MAQLDARGRLCGLMKIEDDNHKFVETGMRYFLLDLEEEKLKLYFDQPEHLPKTCSPCQEIELNFISKVSDARKLRPKAGYCFCITHAGDQIYIQANNDPILYFTGITHAGDQIYIQANNEDEMQQWIGELNEACRITVPQALSPTLAPENSRYEVAGGVINLMHESADSGEESVEHNMPALSLPSYISGYAVKQGAVRKNWKKRYFVLDANGLSYFKHDQDKEPIKTIPLSEITEARLVEGQHHPHRQNLFEVVTADRTYNIQCDTRNDSENWISHINKFARQVVTSDDYSPVKQYRTEPVKKYTSSQPQATSQEEVKPSKAVWGAMTLPVEKRTKQNFRGSKKSWQLW
ncbi:pleckstrin homology domain-containing family A member 1-like isoform X2 [Mercenaria mercenaria]|uniref:pleckstrin homology domain-containing family A member 1-like isoform X2 n=1 Tax=Mercenaria mercenaria TaxID=6596 RepID=UPI00234F645D|nr:pleckstrin homology domain-containing family A member 1-like isoform X2 [Mercenaria mercenaria]